MKLYILLQWSQDTLLKTLNIDLDTLLKTLNIDLVQHSLTAATSLCFGPFIFLYLYSSLIIVVLFFFLSSYILTEYYDTHGL